MRRAGSFFLFLFGLPFAAVGIAAYGAFIWIIYQSIETRSWVKVPATLTHAEISRQSDEGSVTLKPEAKYQYSFNGRDYTGERVSLLNVADNFGGFQKRLGDRLIRHFREHTPIESYVNPRNPAESVLNRDLRYEFLVFLSVFALMFGVIGISIVAACLFGNMGREPALDAEGYLDSSAPESTSIAVAMFIYSSGLLLPLLIYLPGQIEIGNYGAAVFGVVMSVILLFIDLSCYRAREQMLRFGKSRLQIKKFKLAEEGIISGSLITEQSTVSGPLQLKVKFRCVEEGSGDDSSTTLTKSEYTASANAQVGPGLLIPLNVKFKTPDSLIDRKEIPSRIQFEIKIAALKGSLKYGTKFVIKAPIANQLISS